MIRLTDKWVNINRKCSIFLNKKYLIVNHYILVDATKLGMQRSVEINSKSCLTCKPSYLCAIYLAKQIIRDFFFFLWCTQMKVHDQGQSWITTANTFHCIHDEFERILVWFMLLSEKNFLKNKSIILVDEVKSFTTWNQYSLDLNYFLYILNCSWGNMLSYG